MQFYDQFPESAQSSLNHLTNHLAVEAAEELFCFSTGVRLPVRSLGAVILCSFALGTFAKWPHDKWPIRQYAGDFAIGCEREGSCDYVV